MRVRLMHRDRDFDPPQLTLEPDFRSFRRGPPVVPELPPHEQAVMQDLALEILLNAMAGGDDFLFGVARRAILSGPRTDVSTILYRQEITKDCLEHPAVIRELYALAVEATGSRRHYFVGSYTRYPGTILYGALDALQMFVGILRKLKTLAEAQADRFASAGFTTLFAMLRQEFSEEYFATIQQHLKELKFRKGVLMSAQLGSGSEGTNYVLHRSPADRRTWLERLAGDGPPAYTFYIHERDEAGARAVSELQDHGINLVANALAQSSDHILSFFTALRTELAFYVGCLNAHDRLADMCAPICFPEPASTGAGQRRCRGLYDVCLALSTGRSVAGNAMDADGKSLVVITGANQGGKSTFLRSVGLAQLMMQCGMFVPADSFAADLCTGLFTHYKREEDRTMKSGKFDEELARMSQIVETIGPNALVLFNESFSSTNEREGSEIARQIVCALLERNITVCFVTHLYAFARGLFDRHMADALFLRAERRADGTRTFRLVEGEPLQTSYGEDLYKEIFMQTD